MTPDATRRRRRPEARPRILATRRPGPSWRELLEEAKVVLEEHADVVDAEQSQRQPLHAHPEREAGVLVGVVADVFEEHRMHHAAAEDLHPSGLLAQPAALPVAALTLDVHLGGGLGVWEEARAKTRLDLAVEEALRERVQRALEVRQTDALVDDEALDLREHRRMSRVEVVAAVPAPGCDQSHRRAIRLHVADLHPGGMGTQKRPSSVRLVRLVPRGP